MTRIEHIIEPSRLLLAWLRPLQDGQRRNRRVVGEIVRDDSDTVIFRYLDTTEDFQAARQEGFQGYPAFRLNRTEHRSNVLHAFTSRMTSRKRGDFADYLAAHQLPHDYSGSDFSLLAHTGARLPSDGFEIVADFATVRNPFDLVIEVAGTRHQAELRIESLALGDPVAFAAEPDNPVDSDAVVVSHKAGQLGHIPKPYCALLHSRLIDGKTTAAICRLNGRPERPLIYLLARFA